ncbi:MAG: PorT family protein [Bacteroidetes bacterium]|nr:PorT family protein [Bacteroidota bacterium]
MIRSLLILALLFSHHISKSQRIVGVNLPYYDERLMHYGFFMAGNYATFNIKRSQFFVDDTTMLAVNPRGTPGFTLGFVVNLRLEQFFDLRFLPAAGFYLREVIFKLENNDSTYTKVESIESTYIELPLLLKYKSTRRANTRMYLIGGIKPAIEVGTRRAKIGEDRLLTRNIDVALDYGFGIDLYFPMFKFSPEIRFSYGIINLLKPSDNILSNSIDKLRTNTFTVLFIFE